MKKSILYFIFCAILCVANTAAAQQNFIIDLWPDGEPGHTGLTEEKRDDGIYVNVTHPTLEIYLPAKENSNGQFVVICPGGGYVVVAYEHEGRMVAEWLNEHGIGAAILKYRMPGGGNYVIPRADVRKAIETVRTNAEEWYADPGSIGVMGFSAGGHLASTAITHYDSDANRPDFGVLIYPVITMKQPLTHKGSRDYLLGDNPSDELVAEFSNELRVTDKTPPVFIAYSHDDRTVDPRNGTMFYDALIAGKVPAELHIYPSGDHGWGWRERFAYKDELRSSLLRWFSEVGKNQ